MRQMRQMRPVCRMRQSRGRKQANSSPSTQQQLFLLPRALSFCLHLPLLLPILDQKSRLPGNGDNSTEALAEEVESRVTSGSREMEMEGLNRWRILVPDSGETEVGL